MKAKNAHWAGDNRGLPQRAGGLDAFQLKLIAIVCMVIDHVAWFFFPPYVVGSVGFVMRLFGKITFPVMCFFIAEGYRHSSNVKKYLLRLGIFALISIIPYSLAFGAVLNHGLIPNNVYITLFLGLLSLYLADFTQEGSLRLLIVAGCAALSYFGDWSVVGVPMIYIFGRARDKNKRILGGVGAFVGLYTFNFLLGHFLDGNAISPSQIAIAGALLSIPLLYLYNGRRGSNSPAAKYLFYWFYPLHLLLLVLIRYLLR